MGIGFDGNGYIPTFYAKCCHNPKMKTTIYSYSWKTLDTVIYKVNPSCTDSNCGGLNIPWNDRREFSLKMKTICKSNCEINGRAAHKRLEEEEKRNYYSANNNDSYSIENAIDDIPFFN